MHRTDYRYFDNPEFYDAYAVAYGSYAQKASDISRMIPVKPSSTWASMLDRAACRMP